QRVRQEYAADGFATHWVLEKAGAGLNNEFRVLMICVALTWMFLQEAEMGPGPTHPRTIFRLREVAEYFRTGKRSVGVEHAAYVLKAVLDPSTQPPVVDNAEEMFSWVRSRLEILFHP